MVMEYAKQGWKAYKKNWGQILIALLVLFLIVGVIAAIGIIPIFSYFLSPTAMLSMLTSPFLIFSVIIILIAFLVATALGGGLVKLYADSLKRKAKWNVMLKVAKEKFLTLIGANILVFIIFGVIVLALAIPLIALFGASTSLASMSLGMFYILFFIIALFLISPLFIYVNQAVVISNLDAVNAVKATIRIGKNNYTATLGLIVLFAVISFGVGLIPIIGSIINILVVGPVTVLSYTLLYIKKSRIRVRKRRVKRRRRR